MPDDSTKNPLTGTVIALFAGEVWALWQWWVTRREPDVIAALGTIHAIVLITLYFRKSPAAGTFLFYSIVSIYPAYFALMYEGWYAPPQSPWVYVVMAVIWLAGIPIVWKEKRKYERFIAPIAAANRDPAEPR